MKTQTAITPDPADIVEQDNRFGNGVVLFNISHAFPIVPKAGELVATMFANNKGLIDELNVPPPARAALGAFVPCPTLAFLWLAPKARPLSNAPLTPAQHQTNLLAISVVEQNQGPVQQLGLTMVETASRKLRGTPHYDALFRNFHEAGYLDRPALRLQAIRGGQPDVDFRPSPAQQTAREIGVVRQHADIALLPVISSPAAASPRRGGYNP